MALLSRVSPGEYTVYRGLTEHSRRDPTWWVFHVGVLSVFVALESGIDVPKWPNLVEVWWEWG